MNKFVVQPLKGLEWNGRLLPFGASRDEAMALLGTAEVVRGSYYYFNSELRIDFDADGKAEFMEFLGGPDGMLRPELYGANVFESDAEELSALLKAKNGGEIIDAENGYSYAFPAISVGVYRESTPADIADMEGMVPAEEFEFEKRRAFRWATLGFGRAGYYTP
ncbi:MAG: hypothetical protein IKU17_10480 [Clostridia bacterium]|nr:hypothetical protein [Clostridia bacterium]